VAVDADTEASETELRERLTAILRDPSANAGANSFARPRSPGLARVFGRGLPACA
jgi:hypothetical protein